MRGIIMGSTKKNQQDQTDKSAQRISESQPVRTTEEISKLLEKGSIPAVFDSIGDPISIQDTNFHVLYQNKAHRDFIGEHGGEIC